MLPKKSRLKKENDFRKVLRQGKSHKEGTLIIKYAPNQQERTRIGLSVSKKVAKKAVWRNKQKRRLATLARKSLPYLKNGLDVFLIALPGLETKTFTELKEIYEKAFKKAKIFSDDQKDYFGGN